jgi:hypothetical protein
MVFLLLVWPALPAGQQHLSFQSLIAQAEVIVAAEIISSDYSATAADGPMLATARVLKALKGPMLAEKEFSFRESAWVGPTYQKGEHRILFLEKSKQSDSAKNVQWLILSNPYARTDFFIDTESLAALSLESLKSFLHELQAFKPRPNKVVFGKRAPK